MTANSYRKFISTMAILHAFAAIAIFIRIDTVESKIEREIIVCKVETTAYNENFVMCENGSAKK